MGQTMRESEGEPAPGGAPVRAWPGAHATIRRARVQEVAKLTQLALASKAHWPYPPALIEQWRAALTVDATRVAEQPAYVAELNGEVAGFYVLETQTPAQWALRDLWVLPRHIGSGVGTHLLQHACALARASAVAGLTIDADPHAEEFYLARGAQRVGQVAAPIDGEPRRIRPQMLLVLDGQDASGAHPHFSK